MPGKANLWKKREYVSETMERVNLVLASIMALVIMTFVVFILVITARGSYIYVTRQLDDTRKEEMNTT